MAYQDHIIEMKTLISQKGGTWDGIDPETKSYVGATPLLKKQLAALQADKAMPAKEKAEAVKEIEAALAAGEPEKPSPANITLVTRNYARLSAAMAEGDGKPK